MLLRSRKFNVGELSQGKAESRYLWTEEDCPGTNAVIRAVSKKTIIEHGMKVIGIEDGFKGLISDK